MLAPELRAPLYDDSRGFGWQSSPSPRTLSFCVSDVDGRFSIAPHIPRAALHPYLGTGHKQGQLDPSPAAFREAGGGRRAAGSQQPYHLVDAPATWTTAVPVPGQRGWVKGGPARAPQKVCAVVGDGRPRRTRLSSPSTWRGQARPGKRIGNGRTRRGNAGRDDG
ncbi:hypothetical protein E4U15_003090 [Claviceps sp. LM218 group G6]|nr:hypothetical protein E4U15_003090 [Claviceps sp. LM218 group G6]